MSSCFGIKYPHVYSYCKRRSLKYETEDLLVRALCKHLNSFGQRCWIVCRSAFKKKKKKKTVSKKLHQTKSFGTIEFERNASRLSVYTAIHLEQMGRLKWHMATIVLTTDAVFTDRYPIRSALTG